jgi:hypothetical protein
LSSNKNIAIVGMLDVDINASKMVDSAVGGTFFVLPNDGDEPRAAAPATGGGCDSMVWYSTTKYQIIK